MSKIDEIDDGGVSSRNKAYAMAMQYREQIQARNANRDDLNVGKSVTEDETTIGDTSFNEVDGSQVVNRATHISAAQGESEGGFDQGTGKGDHVEAVKLATATVSENIFSFNPALNRIAKRLQTLGVEMTSHVKEALQNLEDNDPQGLKNLSQKLLGLDRTQVKAELEHLSGK